MAGSAQVSGGHETFNTRQELASIYADLNAGFTLEQALRNFATNYVLGNAELREKRTHIQVSYDLRPEGMFCDGRSLRDLLCPNRDNVTGVPIVGDDLTRRLLQLEDRFRLDSNCRQGFAASPDIGFGVHFLYMYTRDPFNPQKISLQAIKFEGSIKEFSQFVENATGSKTTLGPDGTLQFHNAYFSQPLSSQKMIDAAFAAYSPTRLHDPAVQQYLTQLQANQRDLAALRAEQSKQIEELTKYFLQTVAQHGNLHSALSQLLLQADKAINGTPLGQAAWGTSVTSSPHAAQSHTSFSSPLAQASVYVTSPSSSSRTSVSSSRGAEIHMILTNQRAQQTAHATNPRVLPSPNAPTTSSRDAVARQRDPQLRLVTQDKNKTIRAHTPLHARTPRELGSRKDNDAHLKQERLHRFFPDKNKLRENRIQESTDRARPPLQRLAHTVERLRSLTSIALLRKIFFSRLSLERAPQKTETTPFQKRSLTERTHAVVRLALTKVVHLKNVITTALTRYRAQIVSSLQRVLPQLRALLGRLSLTIRSLSLRALPERLRAYTVRLFQSLSHQWRRLSQSIVLSYRRITMALRRVFSYRTLAALQEFPRLMLVYFLERLAQFVRIMRFRFTRWWHRRPLVVEEEDLSLETHTPPKVLSAEKKGEYVIPLQTPHPMRYPSDLFHEKNEITSEIDSEDYRNNYNRLTNHTGT